MQKQPSKGFFKKGRIRNFAEFTTKHVLESLFLIKLNSLGLQLLLKETLVRVFSCEFCKIRKNTTRRLLLIIAVSINSISIIVPWYYSN